MPAKPKRKPKTPPVHRVLKFSEVHKPAKASRIPREGIRPDVTGAGRSAKGVKRKFGGRLGKETQSGRRTAQDKKFYLPRHARFK